MLFAEPILKSEPMIQIGHRPAQDGPPIEMGFTPKTLASMVPRMYNLAWATSPEPTLNRHLIATCFLLVLNACGDTSAGSVGERSHCPDEMVYIASMSVCIDRYESALRGSGDRIEAVAEEGEIPASGVSWFTARQACTNAGKRLCRSSEWQRACQGGEELEWMYAATAEDERCNVAPNGADIPGREVEPSGHREACRSEDGVSDLLGNVSEWVDATDPSGLLRELRGGSYGGYTHHSRCFASNPTFQPPDIESEGLGIRCCRDAN